MASLQQNQSCTLWNQFQFVTCFAEAVCLFGYQKTDLFNMKRSIGIGARILLNPIGLIGFDYGYGFDRRSVDGKGPQWLFHLVGKGF